MYNNACSGTYFYSQGTHHGNLLKSLVTINKVTCYIPRGPYGGNCVSQKPTYLKSWESF